jgi:hypothetical protein
MVGRSHAASVVGLVYAIRAEDYNPGAAIAVWALATALVVANYGL